MELVLATSGCSQERLEEVQDDLRALGYVAILPYTITQRANWTGGELQPADCDDDEAEEHQSRQEHIEAYDRQCNQIELSDGLLVVNEPKYDQEAYIGGRLLMEMTVAARAKVPIFLLRNPGSKSNFANEISLLRVIALGDLEKLPKLLPLH